MIIPPVYTAGPVCPLSLSCSSNQANGAAHSDPHLLRFMAAHPPSAAGKKNCITKIGLKPWLGRQCATIRRVIKVVWGGGGGDWQGSGVAVRRVRLGVM